MSLAGRLEQCLLRWLAHISDYFPRLLMALAGLAMQAGRKGRQVCKGKGVVWGRQKRQKAYTAKCVKVLLV